LEYTQFTSFQADCGLARFFGLTEDGGGRRTLRPEDSEYEEESEEDEEDQDDFSVDEEVTDATSKNVEIDWGMAVSEPIVDWFCVFVFTNKNSEGGDMLVTRATKARQLTRLTNVSESVGELSLYCH